MSIEDVNRRQSIRYVDENEENPFVLTFNSLEKGDLDEGNNK